MLATTAARVPTTTPAKLSRAEAGRAARAAGRAFEKWVEEQHAIAIAHRLLLDMRPVSPRSIILGGGRTLTTGPACADYVGLAAGGQGICVEVKSTADKNISRSEFKPQQIEQLDAYTTGGGLALIVVEFRVGGGRYAVPWGAMPWQTKGRGCSVRPVDLERWRVVPGCYLSRFVSAQRSA